MTTDFTIDELEQRAQRKKLKARKGGKIPPLTDEILDNVEFLREWVNAAMRPRPGWRVVDFEYDQDPGTPCALVLKNGDDRERIRFARQSDLTSSPNRFGTTINSVTSRRLRPPPLSPSELYDLHGALCVLGTKMQNPDELEQAREWMTALLDAAAPIEGLTLVERNDRHDALLALKVRPQFTYLHARAILARPDEPWPRQPACLIDRVTNDYWLRAGESATYVRHILDVKVRQTVLTRRWIELGIGYEHVDDRRATPRLKGYFYRVPQGWIAE
jgi:hypothetical protein